MCFPRSQRVQGHSLWSNDLLRCLLGSSRDAPRRSCTINSSQIIVSSSKTHNKISESVFIFIRNSAPGCRRIVVEPGYLKALHQPNISLNWDGIAKLAEDGIVTKKGEKIPLDVVVFATGFHVVSSSNFLCSGMNLRR